VILAWKRRNYTVCGGRNLGLPYVPVSPDTTSFLAFVRASGRVFENRRFVRVFDAIRKYIRTLPVAKASCRPTCFALSSVHSVSIQKHVSLFV